MCLFHWDYLDEGLKRDHQGQTSGNAGMHRRQVQGAPTSMAALCSKIDAEYRNSDTPTRTQTEEAFVKMFAEMMGDLKGLIAEIGLAVVVSLICVAGNAMAMALRERTTEVAVLKAIGFGKPLVLFLVLAEAMLVAGLGGLLGASGASCSATWSIVAQYTARVLAVLLRPLAHRARWAWACRCLSASAAGSSRPSARRELSVDQRTQEGGLNAS